MDHDDYDLKDSFVDNNEYTQDVSMSLYLKSLHHNQNQNQLRPQRQLRPITEDLFSQMPEQDATYEYDSFVVDDNHISFRKPKKKSKKNKTKKENKTDVNKLKRVKRLPTDDTQVSSMIVLSSDENDENELINHIDFTQFEKRPKRILDESSVLVEENKNIPNPTGIINNKSPLLISKKPETIIEEIEIDDEDFNNFIQFSSALTNLDKKSPSINTSNLSNLQPSKQIEINPNKSSISNTNSSVNTTLNTTNINKENSKNSNWLIANAALLTSAQNVINGVRKLWDQEKVIFQPNLKADFIVSHRLAVITYKWSDLSNGSNRDQILEKYLICQALYPMIVCMIIDDKEANSIRSRTKIFDSVLGHLVKASKVLISKFKTDEISHQLNSLSKSETKQGFHLTVDCAKIFNTKKKEMTFYLGLPNISVVNALYFCQNYDTIVKFCNSSMEDLRTKGKLSEKKARKLLKYIIDSA